MTFISWFQPSRVRWHRARHQCKLQVESLEDRLVPSTLAVTSSDDNVAEVHTLRWAVANAASGDTILIAADLNKTPIVLTQGELLLNHSVTIEGVGNVAETISGGGTSRIFEVAAGAVVTIENLKLTGGNGVASNPTGTPYFDGNGGAILNFGTATVSGCTFIDNSVFNLGGSGGALLNFGTLTVSNSTVYRNSAYFSGGGLQNAAAGTMTLQNSTVSSNFALIFGGGIINQGILNVSSSLLSGNSTYANEVPFFSGGGAIFNTNFESTTGILTITNSTLSGNTASSGGAVYNSYGTVHVDNCLFANNVEVYTGGPTTLQPDGGAILNTGGSAAISGSTFSGNSAGSQGGAVYNQVGATLTVSG